MSVPVYSLAGRAAGKLSLPKEIFGQKVNKNLLAQAVRVYLTNRTGHFGSTKGRGEVRGSTAKIYRQKGTGRARHGAIRAPIFVGGGIAFGPKRRKVILDLPKKMKKAALISALSSKLSDKNIIGVSGIEKASGKTKEVAKFMYQVSSIKYRRGLFSDENQGKDKKGKKMASALIITPEKMDNVVHGVRNIPGISVLPANLINAYEVLKHEMLILTKDAVERLRK
ncbi:50S ribosomal protein L4 [Candidatus Daviesbacteria bacterium RIFCSPLOWO2_01_FULL_39_12]|uniref:Large ribosomal subunit protein uL4 n=1 Tax=Candidatus Daviesbacteria bacterium RIFCSPLOWO2_01_FULL_39_12 TaxID=1797785 RepID=A0A1F5KLM0_9BACT|nr:MAG: 50S ribosomal protein L4 [Candidatus Daviesbacteria bacterium RIFCSPHIGHO2_02_FULL_39_8]OGE41720.1 MAG: 50S ribosomal protein L4 [Candidatus Daviesbacteria bacterium RIFCSPLOWO2_01_FULL_39_12]